jgi:exopolyphosphatase / guanosine-5'-triphosphate,3'-diphosphate pyrophosphatase
MRLGVLDVGSNTVHFLVIDALQGGRPLPVFSHKAELHLGDHLVDGNRLSASVTRQLRAFVDEALQIAEDKGVEELLAFATSAVRDAANGDEVLGRVKEASGVDIRVLTGEEEARLTFLAARRWFGWSPGRLLMLDIGGGSLEIAAGIDEEREPARARAGAAVAQARAGRDRAPGLGRGPGRAARSCGGHIQDVPAACQDLRRRSLGRGAVRAPRGHAR